MKYLAFTPIALALVIGIFFLIKNNNSQDPVILAAKIFKQAVNQRRDLSQGPCLSNDLMQDWVLDVAHNPRQSIDDQPENQCEAFRNGRAHHFVEFDTEGKLIRKY